MKKKLILVALPLVLLAVIGLVVFLAAGNVVKAPADKPIKNTVKTTDTTVKTTDVTTQVSYPVILTLEEAAKIDVVVNKKHKLPDGYEPTVVSVAGGQMRQEAAVELQKLLDAASSSGNNLKIISAYRSYSNQVSTYNGWVSQYGQTKADTFSARPGFSEHQTGLAVDLGNTDGSCALELCFANTLGGKWLAANAVNYGFIIRYPVGKDVETGYQYEPWHIRFVGVELAKKIVVSGKTLDQYFNVIAGNY